MRLRQQFLWMLGLAVLVGCKTTNVLTTAPTTAPNSFSTPISLAETERIITTLASDQMEGREFGTKGFDLAADWTVGYLRDAGVKPFFNDFKDTVVIRGKKTANIVGLIGTRDDTKEYILLGAHLDHIGKAKGKNKVDTVYNGANDDASGVTAVLQIAAHLQQQRPNANVIVALFTAEESGLLGSEYLAPRLKKLGIKIKYMVNFEMIGKAMITGSNRVYITGYNKSNFAKVSNQLMGFQFIHYLHEEKKYDLFKRSDNYSFYETYGVPSHTISTFDFQNYNYYHQLKDEVGAIDIIHMNSIINRCATLVIGLVDGNPTIE
jgi:bacterial leucyl aminopeptidase